MYTLYIYNGLTGEYHSEIKTDLIENAYPILRDGYAVEIWRDGEVFANFQADDGHFTDSDGFLGFRVEKIK